MKLLSFLSALILLCNSNAFAQTFEKIEDSLQLAEFEIYVQSILEQPLDTTNATGFLGNYQLRYSSSCPYSETISLSDSSFCDIIASTGGKHFSVRTNSKKQLTDPAFRVPIPSEPGFKVCLDNVALNRDTLTLYTVDPSSHLMQRIVNTNYQYLKIGELGTFEAITFNEGKYLLLSSSGLSYVGSQTSHGNTVTYFLERE